jgi:probable HAF family extracellular repeat protein
MTSSYCRKGEKQGDELLATASSRKFTKVTLALLLAVCATPQLSRAATPPTATLLYSDPAMASIHGGVATIGTGGTNYFSALSTGTTRARVIKLNPSGAPVWTFNAPGTGPTYDMYAIPALDSAGAKLYIGSDAGIFYCLNTSDGSTAWTYPVPTGTDKRIRSGAAIDPISPAGPTVYFHCNNGRLYALNAATGALRWSAATGNVGGPPVDPEWDTQPVSSSPVVDSSSAVYVGSADGSVYSFNPSNGAQNWRVVLNSSAVEPVEATIAIGQNGILYVGTRGTSSALATMYAIAAVTHTIVWSNPFGGFGFIASPVIDQSGNIYAAHFDNQLFKLSATDGSQLQSWFLSGKLCQTPSLNQNGLLIIGVSSFGESEVNEIAAINIGDPNTVSPLWEITQTGGQNFGNFFGAPAILCASAGTTYFADALGKVCTFNGGGYSGMMAGTWPTFQCGNRRAGKSMTYPTVIAELPPFFCSGSPYCGSSSVSRVDLWGRAVGQSYGDYTYPFGGDIGFSAAVWRASSSIQTPGRYSGNHDTYGTAINVLGDVCGYRTSPSYVPLAWPDGANSDTGYHILSSTGFSAAYAYAINADGTIVGYGINGSAVNVLRWAKSSATTWNAPDNLQAPAGGQAYAYAITDDGRIAGIAKFTSGGPLHAFNTRSFPVNLASDAVDMGTMGGTGSEAWDMNPSKGTVGRSQLSTGYWRAFLLPISAPNLGGSAIYQVCGLPGVTRTDWSSAAYGVNKFGQVVGYAQDQNLANRAVLYSDPTGITTDLTTLPLGGGQTPASLGWTLTQAQSINDAGVIIGTGSQNGVNKSWILYPDCQD